MKKMIHIVFILVLLAAIGVGAYKYVENYKENKRLEPMRNDYARMAQDDYTSIFFSTFAIDNFSEEDFTYYRKTYPLKSSYCIPDLETLNSYFDSVMENGREITSIQLGIRPDIVSAEELLGIIDRWYGVPVEVLVAYPSLEYWADLEEEEYTATLNAYKDFINTLMPYYEEDPWIQGNVTIYFFGGTRWLVDNPANYDSDFGVNEGIAHSLTLQSFVDRNYILTLDNYEEEMKTFETLIEECRETTEDTDQDATSEYPDLSKWDVVFFGDSLTAFQETSSYPGAFGGLTGAHVYNCAQGGSSAAVLNDAGTSLTQVVDSFLAQDASGYKEDTLVYKGITDYAENAKKKRKKCFVINFGMNDYFTGHTVSSDDPYDTNTYAGALRTAIEDLQGAYPEATIVLMTPNYTSYFNNGMEPQSETGGLLVDYIAAMDMISMDYELPLYNCYTKLGINDGNHLEYLQDGCHPNETTRYMMAQDLAELMWDVVEE